MEGKGVNWLHSAVGFTPSAFQPDGRVDPGHSPVVHRHGLLALPDPDTDPTRALWGEPTDAQGRFPSRRTWERRLQALPGILPGLRAVGGAIW